MVDRLPALSIGLPVRNGERFLRDALDSLLGQSFGDFELTISDNASTDATPDICREYAARDPRFRYVRQPSNLGLLANVELVMRQARGKYCLLVGDDDVYEPRFAETLVGLLADHPDAGLAYSGFTFIDVHGDLKPAVPSKVRFEHVHSPFRNCFMYIRVRVCLPMIFGVFRTALFQRALPFVDFGYTTADADNLFMLRFLSLARVVSTPEILFHYRIKERSGVFNGFPSTRMAQRLYMFRHRRAVTSLMSRIVNTAEFSPIEKALLKAHANLDLALHALV